MKLAQLKTLVKMGESERLEFKASTASLTAGMQTICAFLNSDHGGVVLFGVKDDGKIIGQDITDKTRKEIATELNKIEPHERLDVLYVSVADHRQVIVIAVEPGEKSPYTYDGRAFMRNQSTTMRMSQEVYAYLYNKSNPALWESSTNNSCILRDLDKNRIQEVISMAVSEKRLPEEARSGNTNSILKKLGLIIDNKLSNAAVILFCKDEHKQFMQSTIKLARFKGITKSEFLNQKMVRANAFDLYDKAMDFLGFSLPVTAKIEAGKSSRIETPAIPYTVLREALTNALVHRDYSHPGTSIDVAIYDDRVTITNPGFLPKGVKVEQLSREHKSIQRNPLIAHVFYLCGKIEKWGRGTLDMIYDCKKAGNPPPKFEEIGGGFSVTLFLREPMQTILYEKPSPVDIGKLPKRHQRILQILQQGALTRQQIMAHFRIKVADRTLQHDLGTLKKLSIIKSEGKGRATQWSLIGSKIAQ